MKITSYYIYGGESLNDDTLVLGAVEADAFAVFERWKRVVADISHGDRSFLDLPVNHEKRLFINYFDVERPGKRAISYIVGYCIEKQQYLAAESVGDIHAGINALSWSHLEQAWKGGEASLDVALVPQARVVSSPLLSLEQLSDLFYGVRDNQNDALSLIYQSLGNLAIEEWFGKLSLAVNPVRYEPTMNICLSARPYVTAQPKKRMPACPCDVKASPFFMFLAALLLILGVSVALVRCSSSDKEERSAASP